jgi:serralysin
VQQAAVRSALAMYAAVADVGFTETAETPLQHADLRFAMSDKFGTAWAYFPSAAAEGGDAWFNQSLGQYANPVSGNEAYMTVLHEVGHALGLDHAHEQSVMPAERDSMEYTVMSYRSYVGASITAQYDNETWGYAQSLMVYDIAAVQHLYGANYATNDGDTTYSWSPTTGEMSVDGAGQGAPGANRIFRTIWDGGGIDTYDFSNYATNLKVDLQPGHWSTLSHAQRAKLDQDGSKLAAGNIANALLYDGDPRSLIENATGGSGNDIIIGNAAANTLRGNAGNDTLHGSLGADHHDGGAGFDYARYDDASYDSFVVALAASSLGTGVAEGDTFAGIEGLILARGNDRAYGDAGDNRIYGLAGNDNLYGSLGADYLHGGAGFDYARFDDAAYGGLRASLSAGIAGTGAARGDVFVEIEGLVLSGNGDTGIGNNQANYLYGLGGSDKLYGKAGRDHLFGGAGRDVFVFDTPAGAANADVIGDFVRGQDRIALSKSIFGANQTLRFDAGSGDLYWCGPSKASASDDVLVATLTGVKSLSASDYYFY